MNCPYLLYSNGEPKSYLTLIFESIRAIATVTHPDAELSENFCLGTNKISVCAAHRAAASATLAVPTNVDTN